MGTLLAKNADVLVTMDAARRELRGAGLYAVDGFIRKVGVTAELPARPPTWFSTSPARSCCPASSTRTTT